jgi:pyridoxal phosphate enzyme (YggS family)
MKLTEVEAQQEKIADNYRTIQERIVAAAVRAHRNAADIQLVAVTKTVPASLIEMAVRVGVRILGENRIQEAQTKIPVLRDRFPDVQWHLIGHLQTNKVRKALELFDMIQSVDSLHLAQSLERRAATCGHVLPVLLEVNVAAEPSKYGFGIDELHTAASELVNLPHLRIEGLMTVAPMVSDPEEVRPVFRRLRELRDELAARYTEVGWHTLSMGMSDDFEVAIEEGATLVRLGRALFGPRLR